MKKNKNLLIAILMMIIGFILNGLAWSTVAHPYNMFSVGSGIKFFGINTFHIKFSKEIEKPDRFLKSVGFLKL